MDLWKCVLCMEQEERQRNDTSAVHAAAHRPPALTASRHRCVCPPPSKSLQSLGTGLILRFFPQQRQWLTVQNRPLPVAGLTSGRGSAVECIRKFEASLPTRKGTGMGTTPQPEAWEQVSAVLESPEWNFMTIDGLAKKNALVARGDPNVSSRTRSGRSSRPCYETRRGKPYNTSRSRRKSLREFFAEMQAFARNSF